MVLWRALNQEGFCEAKTQEFVAQLQGWGWACNATDAAEPAAEPAEADDTQALTPAEETEPSDQ